MIEIDGLSPIEKKALEDVKNILTERYQDNLILLKLFGSKARGNSQLFSDIDLLVVVEKDSWKASEQMSEDVYEVMEKYDYQLLITLVVLDQKEYSLEKRIGTCFYESIEQEGVSLWKKG